MTRSRSKRLAVSFNTLGRSFDLDLEPNDDLFAPGAKNVWIDDAGQVEEEPGRVFYRGRLKGSRNSWVRMTVERGTIDGMIWTPEEVYFVEPASRFFADAGGGEMIAYRLSDTESDWTDESCAVQTHSHRDRDRKPHSSADGRTLYQQLARALQQIETASTGTKELDLGLVADFEYYGRHGGASATFMQSVVNLIDGVYQREINLKLRISHTIVYGTSSDPFSSTTDPSTALNEMGTFKGNNSGPGGLLYGADLAHLFTGRDLTGSTVGIAWVGTVCNSSTGAGLSQDYTSTINSLVSLTAHEMGHNLAASHDTTVGCPAGYIMNPSVVTVSDLQNLHFSTCSKTAIGNHIATRSCLADYVQGTPTATPTSTSTPLPTSTRTPTPYGAQFVSQSVPTSMSAGQQYQVSITVRNSGSNVWSAAQGYKLGVQPWNDPWTWGMNRVALTSTDAIANGQQKTFTFTVTAPTTPGTYGFQWRMLREGVTWFGDLTPNVQINVQAVAGNVAQFVSQSVPTSMTAGQQYQVAVTMRNAGSTTWTPTAGYKLGVQPWNDPWTWGLARVLLGGSDSIAPGGQKTFTFTVRAPSTPGAYGFQWRMILENVEWFGTMSPAVQVDVQGVSGNASAPISQSVPSTMTAGQQYQVSITMENMGGNVWTADAGYKLGVQPWNDPWTWGLARVALDPSDAIASGQQKTFVFTVVAPTTPGTYSFQWRMLLERVEWFGELSPAVQVTVE